MVAPLTHSMPAENIIIISGPTASGKTGLAINVAEWLQQKKYPKPAIVNFDSLCFYKELSIGTAKPTQEEQKRAEHFMIDVASARAPLSAAEYIRQAIPVIQRLHADHRSVILVGGSAFYLRALIKGMYRPSEDQLPVAAVQTPIPELSPQEQWKILQQCDPASAKKLHPNDHYRIQRALSYFHEHGKPFSEAARAVEDPYDFSTPQFPNWRLLHIYLSWPKEILWQRILQRVDQMFSDGIVAEHQRLLLEGFSGQERPLQSVGHYEVGKMLKGEIANEADCRQLIAIATRQLAKSQRTFFNKIHPKHTIDPRAKNDVFELLELFLNSHLQKSKATT